MKSLIITTILSAGLFVGCSSVQEMQNGKSLQKACISGECYTLLGAGEIFLNLREDTVNVQCEGKEMAEFAQDELTGYDCTTNQKID